MEILVSIVILAVGSVLILQGLVRGAYALTAAGNRSTVYAFTASKMADLELAQRQGAALDPGGHFGTGRRQFTWRVNAAPVNDDPELELVTLTVGWRQDRHPYESSVSMVRRVPPPEERQP